MKIALFAATVAAATVSLPAHAQSDAIVGEVRPFAFAFCPEGWVEANGQMMPVRGQALLYSLLGTTYGGDGISTFAVPDMRKTAALPANGKPLHYCIAIRGDYPRRP